VGLWKRLPTEESKWCSLPSPPFLTDNILSGIENFGFKKKYIPDPPTQKNYAQKKL
jgi:hypothetical protein